MTPPRSDLRSPPPGPGGSLPGPGGAAGGSAEPDARRLLEGAAGLAAAALGLQFAALLDRGADSGVDEQLPAVRDEPPADAGSSLLDRPPITRDQTAGDERPKDDKPQACREPDPQPEPKPTDPLPSPMALFTRTPEPAPVREPTAPPPESISTPLALRIETLAVSTDQDGHRRVRLTLADNALPDTDVEVGHDAGELQVAFFCRRPEGRQALEAQAPQLADTLAQRLQRPVCVSVGGTQRDEAGRVTAQARPDDRGSA